MRCTVSVKCKKRTTMVSTNAKWNPNSFLLIFFEDFFFSALKLISLLNAFMHFSIVKNRMKVSILSLPLWKRWFLCKCNLHKRKFARRRNLRRLRAFIAMHKFSIHADIIRPHQILHLHTQIRFYNSQNVFVFLLQRKCCGSDIRQREYSINRRHWSMFERNKCKWCNDCRREFT